MLATTTGLEAATASIAPVPGGKIASKRSTPYMPRLERVKVPDSIKARKIPTVLVDYAHTPDGLKNALKACRPFSKGKLICVFGCGGDRDVGKRSLMGQIAAEFSDYIFLTSDNPRSEDPQKILNAGRHVTK